jgi:phosphoglycerate dehydrogenase-like enzyme
VTLVWLPEDDWQDRLFVPPEVDVEVWRSGLAVPSSVDHVDFYVPEYLGPAAVVDIIASMSSLRVVQTLTAGYEHLVDRLPPGVTLCNARGVHDASTAELAVGLTLASLRGIPSFVRGQDLRLWRHARHDALADKQVLVIGLGAVGEAVVSRLSPFEVEVIAVARRSREAVFAVDDLPRLLPNADVVILTVPLNDQTTGMVDAAFLGHMKDGALLVNVSRGQVVDTNALVTELHSGRLLAALDVTDPEPLPTGHPLWGAPNLLISPHVGGDTTAFLPRAWRLLQAQIDRYVAGEDLANVVAQSSG